MLYLIDLIDWIWQRGSIADKQNVWESSQSLALPVVSTLLMLLVAFDPSMSTLPIIVLWLNFVCVAVALLGFVWLAHSLRDYTWDAIICFAGSFFEI